MNRKVLNLLINHLFCIVVFFSLYAYLFTSDKKNFNTAENMHDILYFTSSTHSTCGFGDIVPTSSLAKTVVMCHHAVIVLLTIQMFYCFLCNK